MMGKLGHNIKDVWQCFKALHLGEIMGTKDIKYSSEFNVIHKRWLDDEN